MKQRIGRIICTIIFTMTALMVNSQVYLQDTSFTEGTHTYIYTDTIISPGVDTLPFTVSDSAKVTFRSTRAIYLKKGFDAGSFCSGGYFEAYFAYYPFDIEHSHQHVKMHDTTRGQINTLPRSGHPPYTYIWNTNDTTDTLSNIWTGKYMVTITDDFDSTETLSFDILTDIRWVDTAGVLTGGDSIIKTDTAQGFNSGAVSKNRLVNGAEGYILYIVGEAGFDTLHRFLGFSDKNLNASDSTIDYAFYFDGDTVRIYEADTLGGSFGAYVLSDTFMLARDSGMVRYYRNDSLLRQVSADTVSELMADISLYEKDAYFKGLRLSFGIPLKINTIYESYADYKITGAGLMDTITTDTIHAFEPALFAGDCPDTLRIMKLTDSTRIYFTLNNYGEINNVWYLGVYDTIPDTLLALGSDFYEITDDSSGLIFLDGETPYIGSVFEIGIDLEHGLVMSPNGDESYDEFLVSGADQYTDFSLEIYDINGDKVFETTDPQESWDGKHYITAELVSAGPYVYQINIDCDSLEGQFILDY